MVSRERLPGQAVSATDEEILRADAVSVTAGLELLDTGDKFLGDISADLVGGVVERNALANTHGTCVLQVARAINWQRHRLRPYLVLENLDTGESSRFTLGVYLPETPEQSRGVTPVTFTVEGYDKLLMLDTPRETSLPLAAGTGYLAAVKQQLTQAGVTAREMALDEERADAVLPTDRLWPLDEKNTYKRVVNDLLSEIDYRAIWVDAFGTFRSGPNLEPSRRPVLWRFNMDDPETTIVTEETDRIEDLFDIPNQWVFVRDDPAAETFPVEGDGLYTVVNQSDGVTSIDARGGRKVTRIEHLAVATHADLVSRGNRIVDLSKNVLTHIELDCSPCPVLWHGDVVRFTGQDVGLLDITAIVQRWRLPLDGSNMSVRLRQVRT